MSFRKMFTVLRAYSDSLISHFRYRYFVKTSRQAAVTGLILILVSNHALAGPVPTVLAGALTDLRQETRFWWHASGWAQTFSHWFPRRSARQSPQKWDGRGAPER